MPAVNRSPQGLTNRNARHPFGNMGIPDPTWAITYFNDFMTFNTADWTITTTEAGAGSATEALADGAGGLLLITNDAADNDADFFQKVGEAFKFTSGKRLAFAARFKVSDATQSDFVMGLQITDTTPLDVSDGVFFMKDDGDASLDFYVEKDGTQTAASAIATVANDTFLTVAFEYDGKSAIKYFVDGVHKGTSATTNLPDDEDLTVSFGIQNGEAVAKTMTVDYVLVMQER